MSNQNEGGHDGYIGYGSNDINIEEETQEIWDPSDLWGKVIKILPGIVAFGIAALVGLLIIGEIKKTVQSSDMNATTAFSFLSSINTGQLSSGWIPLIMLVLLGLATIHVFGFDRIT